MGLPANALLWIRIAWPGLLTWGFALVVRTALAHAARDALLPVFFLLSVLCLLYVCVSLRIRGPWAIRIPGAVVKLSFPASITVVILMTMARATG